MFTDDQGERHETPEELSIEKKLDLILAEVKHMRSAFPKDEDGVVKGDQAQIDAYIAACQAVKSKYPKPE